MKGGKREKMIEIYIKGNLDREGIIETFETAGDPLNLLALMSFAIHRISKKTKISEEHIIKSLEYAAKKDAD